MLNTQIISMVNWSTYLCVNYIRYALSRPTQKIFSLDSNLIIKTTAKNLQYIIFFLKNHTACNYNQLIEIAVEDTPKRRHRFRVNYILSSFQFAKKAIISVTADELSSLPSITWIFSSAGWLEREVWDLFGIYFRNHPNLRRILTDYGFPCHPLRKDFPLSGFFEIYYSLDKKRIITERIELAQEYRVFNV